MMAMGAAAGSSTPVGLRPRSQTPHAHTTTVELRVAGQRLLVQMSVVKYESQE
jgi:hypothetical protein